MPLETQVRGERTQHPPFLYRVTYQSTIAIRKRHLYIRDISVD